MRAYTWTDKALTRHAGRFVWLSLDMEKAKNAPARKQIGITAFPTLYVVDPSDGHVAIRWLGGASVAQLERLFKQYLGSLPSRYYLELRLQRARQLLLETHYSIVQVGLMCGFSSGSHFSTAFGALFGNTPREERQRKLSN